MPITLVEAMLKGVPEQTAREINDEHRAVGLALRDSLEHARRCGELLNDVKDKLPHGAFMAWVERHCVFSHRAATMYMRIAREWERLSANWQSVANFGLVLADEWLALPEQTGDNAIDEARLARWAAEDAEAEAEATRRRADPEAHLTKWLWQEIGDRLGALHDTLMRLQDHVGEGNPIVDQMIMVVERLDDERYKQESAFYEVDETGTVDAA